MKHVQRRLKSQPAATAVRKRCTTLANPMVNNPITIDDSLRLVFARLEGVLGVLFNPREIDRVFADAIDNQRDEKRYVFFDSPKVHVTGYVEDYEPETIEISVDASRSMVARCAPIIDAACGRLD